MVKKASMNGEDMQTKGAKLSYYTSQLEKAKRNLQNAIDTGNETAKKRNEEIIRNLQWTIGRL